MDKRFIDEYTEASKRYEQLKEKLNRGEIVELNLLPDFIILDAFEKNEASYPALTYTPCFSYVDKLGHKFIEDVKANSEHERILRVMFEYTYMNLTVRDIL